MELSLGTVVVVGGPHAADDGQVIDHATDVGEEIGDLDAALAAFFKLDLGWIEFVSLLTVGIVDHGDAGLGEFFGILHTLIG